MSPLEIVEDAETVALLDDRVVKKFIAVKDLCGDHTRSLVDRIVAQDELLNSPTPYEEMDLSASEQLIGIFGRPTGIEDEHYKSLRAS